MIFEQVKLYLAGAAELIVVIVVFVAGYHVRGLEAGRDEASMRAGELSALVGQQSVTLGAQKYALDRAGEYEKAQLALKPIVVKVKSDAQPYIQVLDKCALPDGSVQLLDRAAALAGAGFGALVPVPGASAERASDAAGSKIGAASAGQADSRGPVPPNH